MTTSLSSFTCIDGFGTKKLSSIPLCALSTGNDLSSVFAKMAGRNDPRRQVDAHVHAFASAVTSASECSRLYGFNTGTKLVNGTVLQVIVKRTSTGRESTSLKVPWKLVENEGGREKTTTLKIVNVKNGRIAPTPSGAGTSSQDVHFVPGSYQTINNNQESTPGSSRGTTRLPGSADYVAHDVCWYESPVRSPIGGKVPRRRWRVQSWMGNTLVEGCGIGDLQPYDCFMSTFPHGHLKKMADWTSKRLSDSKLPETSIGELLRFFGILILCTRFEFGRKTELWSRERRSKYIPAPHFGATGMSRNRFTDLLAHARFSNQPEEQDTLPSVHYRWLLVQDFVEAINEHRKNSVTPSETICVDESISRWYGLGGHWIEIGLPQYVAIERKPENECEIQDAACGKSGIMLRLELVTTAEDEIRRNGSCEIQHGTAVACRLLAPWAGTGRVVCADSYFASVSNAESLLEMGLKFIGVIKTATKKYPMAYLANKEVSERGEHVSMVRKDDCGRVLMMALMWVDRERRYFVSTAYTSLDGAPYIRDRWRQTSEGPKKLSITVQQPQVCEMYYRACVQVDRHNRCRQDDLNLEKKVGTQDWSFRVNSSLLGVCVVDSWLLFTGGQGDRNHIDQQAFFEVLATQLIDNTYDERSLRNRSSHVEGAMDSTVRTGAFLARTDRKRRKQDGTVTPYPLQNNCRICKTHKTSYLCSTCRELEGNSIWLCGPATDRDCFPKHLKDTHK